GRAGDLRLRREQGTGPRAEGRTRGVARALPGGGARGARGRRGRDRCVHGRAGPAPGARGGHRLRRTRRAALAQQLRVGTRRLPGRARRRAFAVLAPGSAGGERAARRVRPGAALPVTRGRLDPGGDLNMHAQGFSPLARDLPLDFQDHSAPRISRRLGYAGLACAAVVGLVFAAHRITARDAPFATEPARTGDLTVTVTATGTLVPIDQVDIGSELSGTLRSVDVGYNDHVSSGQVLAHLD